MPAPTLTPQSTLDRLRQLAAAAAATPAQESKDFLAAVQQNGLAIEFLTDAQRTPEVVLAAVRQNGYAIVALTGAQRTPEVVLAAVRQDGSAIQFLTADQILSSGAVKDHVLANWEQLERWVPKALRAQVAQGLLEHAQQQQRDHQDDGGSPEGGDLMHPLPN